LETLSSEWGILHVIIVQHQVNLRNQTNIYTSSLVFIFFNSNYCSIFQFNSSQSVPFLPNTCYNRTQNLNEKRFIRLLKSDIRKSYLLWKSDSFVGKYQRQLTLTVAAFEGTLLESILMCSFFNSRWGNTVSYGVTRHAS
jgi:hypothetical protein